MSPLRGWESGCASSSGGLHPRLSYDAAFAALGIDASYVALDVAPVDLGAVVAGFREAPDFMGANVTVPHKRAIMGLLDDVDDTAGAIGAVNTVGAWATPNP